MKLLRRRILTGAPADDEAPGRANLLAPASEAPVARIKNRRKLHDWQAVSGYDAERDGPDPRYARMGIRCSACGEERRVGVSLAEMRYYGGCWREGSLPYQENDMVVTPDGCLDEFQALLADGRALTHNAGGRTSTFRLDELRPAQ